MTKDQPVYTPSGTPRLSAKKIEQAIANSESGLKSPASGRASLFNKALSVNSSQMMEMHS